MTRLEDTLVQQIVDAVEGIEISETDAWADLDILSTHTFLEKIEVEPEGVVISGSHFSGTANIYVSLQYGSDSDDGFTTSDSFVADFSGEIVNGDPVVNSLQVDTSDFYADEEPGE